MNGVKVTGMSQPEVVQLLRDSQSEVTITISRQEAVEAQEEEEVRRWLWRRRGRREGMERNCIH